MNNYYTDNVREVSTIEAEYSDMTTPVNKVVTIELLNELRVNLVADVQTIQAKMLEAGANAPALRDNLLRIDGALLALKLLEEGKARSETPKQVMPEAPHMSEEALTRATEEASYVANGKLFASKTKKKAPTPKRPAKKVKKGRK